MTHMVEFVVVAVGLGVLLFQEGLHPLVFKARLEFLPLMLNSLYSAAFNICWIGDIYRRQLTSSSEEGYDSVPS